MPSRSFYRSINSPAPSASSKLGFTLIEALISIGIFVLLVVGSTTLYTSWRATTDHSKAVTEVVNLIEKAEHNALSSVTGTDWIIEQTTASSLTLRNATATTTETIALPDTATIDWRTHTMYTFQTPDGMVAEPGTMTIRTTDRSTDITIRSNGTIEISSTTL
ncbi:MAG: hypothetical protein WC495_01700 [Patescibacteria group bacterium]